MCQWHWTGKRVPFAGYARTGRKETCYRKQPGKRNFGWEPEENEQRLSVTAKTGRKQSRLAEETKGGRQSPTEQARGSLWSTPRRILHSRGWENPANRGLHHEEWAQEDMAAFHRFEENLRHYHCVICKETWQPSASRQQIFSCSRCKRDRKPCRLYSAENDMDPGSVPAELQGLSEVEELLIARAFPIVSIYRKHGGQRGYKGHVLNLPQDIQGFLNSLPANVSDLPILVMRKQGAGEPLK